MASLGMSIRSRVLGLRSVFALQSAALLLVACGSSSSSSSSLGSGGAGASGGSGGTGFESSGGKGGSSAGGNSTVVQRPFWCDEYRPVDAAQLEGWVSINPTVVGRGSGNMTSPIQSCTVTGSNWSVKASGIETDGVDNTTMSFELTGAYNGPGRYKGKLSDGIDVSFSHDDLGVTFSSTPVSECELCVNDDGLSGTVQCRALESPLGSTLELSHIPSGQFTCTGAAVKPSSATVKPAVFTNYSGSSWLCHYLDELDCAGRMPSADCVRTHDVVLIDGPCSTETSAWMSCIQNERPSQLSCANTPGDNLVSASGQCETERKVMDDCRVAAGADGNGSSGTETSAECDAFCNKLLAQCGTACSRNICRTEPGQCTTSTKAFLKCLSEGDHIVCGQSGTYTYSGCAKDDTLCGTTGAGGGSAAGGGGAAGGTGNAPTGGASGVSQGGAPTSTWTVTPCDAAPPSCASLPHTCGANGNGDCCESDLVPGGDFFRQKIYSPATVHSFCLDKYEVSVGRMRRFLAAYPVGLPLPGVGNNPYNADDAGWDEAWTAYMPTTPEALGSKLAASNCSGPRSWRTDASSAQNDNYPINCINWYVAYAFCAWDGGWLPTRVEWEFAARAGNQQRIFPWSVPPDNRQHDTTQATFSCDTCDSPPLTPVGAKPAGDGLYGQSDLIGNVMEWVQDFHTYDYPEPCNDCADLTSGEDRELLGGSATSYDSYLAQAYDDYPPTQTWGYIGFRCARR